MPVADRPAKIGKYEITDVIGEGGMGAVYKATDPRIGRTVAIKVIKGDFSDNPELLKRFYREAQAVGNLQHPNIVVVYDLGEEHGNPYLVMEYLNGIPLDKIIAQRQSVPLVQKLGIVSEVLSALHYAHQHNIVHRDVKPANVMVLRDGHVKLLDFGIAREGDLGQTKTGQVMGTMWYMSPEQLNSEPVDGRSDVYSTGILFFELLAYTLPFDPRDMTGMIVKRLRGDATPPLSKYLESYPPELDEIIARALTVDRELRYVSAEEFAFELSRLQERLKRDMVSHLVDEARASIAQSDLDKAKALLSRALQVDTQNPTAKQLLYEIQQTLQRSARNEKVKRYRDQAANALAEKQLEHAVAFVNEAIKLDSTDPDLLGLKEQIEQAKSRAQQVKKLLTLARVAQQTGELVVARKAVDDALALDPQDTDARMMQSVVARQFVEYEKRRQIQQFLESARREIVARQFTAAQENVAKAKAIDQAYPEIPGLEKMLKAGLEQEARQRELARLCIQIEQELNANRPNSARDIAANAMRKFPGEPTIVRLKAAAEAAIEKEERRAYVEERITAAARMIEGNEAERALRLIKDAERDHPTDLRLREYLDVVRQAVARENAAREKAQLLQQARSAMRNRSFAQAISVLEGALVQFSEDAEIKDLLKAARDEFKRLEKKKQVEDVSKQAQDLLQSRAHTDAIRLLERTAAQVSDLELANLLQYARQEAEKFRAEVQQAGEQATQLLNLGQHSEAVTFLEAQVDKFGKNADFRLLLEQARRQAEETQRAIARLQANLKDARVNLRAQDIHGAEALLRVCELEAPNDADVKLLAVEVEEGKKAEERRQAEAAERAAREQQETERHLAEEARRATQLRQEEERRQSEAAGRELQTQRDAAERKLRKQREVAGPAPSLEGEATVLDVPGALGTSPAAARPLEGAPVVSSATQMLGAAAAPATPKPEKLPAGKEPTEGKAIEVSPAAPPVEVAHDRMETIVAEPKLVPPPPPPVAFEPPQPGVQPPGNKRLMLFAGGGLGLVLLTALIWWVVHIGKPELATVKIIGAPRGATYQIGDVKGAVAADGSTQVSIPTGDYKLDVDAPGYDHYSKMVTARAGENEVPVKLEKTEESHPIPPAPELSAEVAVQANIPGFDVYEGSNLLGRAHGKSLQISLKQGDHEVRIEKSGYKSFEQGITITSTNKQAIRVSLVEDLTAPNRPVTDAILTVQTVAGAQVQAGSLSQTADGKGVALFKVPLGPVDIHVSLGGYKPMDLKENVNADRTVPAKLEKSVEAKVEKPVEGPPTPLRSASVDLFIATPSSIQEGEPITLAWSTQNAESVSIDPGGRVDKVGKRVVPNLNQTTTYVLTATGPDGGSVRKEATVTVQPKPAEVTKVATKESEKSSDQDGIRQAHQNFEAWLARGEWSKLSSVQGTASSIKQLGPAGSLSADCDPPKIHGDQASQTCRENLSILGKGPVGGHTGTYTLRKVGDTWTIVEWRHTKP